MTIIRKLRAWRRLDWPVASIVVVAAALRLYSSVSAPYLYIEAEEYVKFAQRISWDHLPIREMQHAALPSYLIKFSGLLFGQTRVGYRMLGVLAGVGTILVIYRLGLQWWGRGAARWAALLLAVNEYHVAISARAVELVYDLWFVAVAMYAFTRFLKTERPAWLLAAGAASGLGFLCKEITCLMVPVFLIALLVLPQRRWLLRKEPWLALLVFVAVISPDVWHTLRTPVEGRSPRFAGYDDHLSRVGGLGLNGQPWVFYFADALDWAGIPYENSLDSIQTMNPLSAAVLWAGVMFVSLRKRESAAATFLLVMFWSIFAFFALILSKEPSRPELHLDPVLWYWADRTMLPAALMAGIAISRCFGLRKAG